MSVAQLHMEMATIRSNVERLGFRIDEGFPQLNQVRSIIEQALIQMNTAMAYNVDGDLVSTTLAQLDFFANDEWPKKVERAQRRLWRSFDRIYSHIIDSDVVDQGNNSLDIHGRTGRVLLRAVTP